MEKIGAKAAAIMVALIVGTMVVNMFYTISFRGTLFKVEFILLGTAIVVSLAGSIIKILKNK